MTLDRHQMTKNLPHEESASGDKKSASSDAKSESMNKFVQKAYEDTLKKYHGFIAANTFKVKWLCLYNLFLGKKVLLFYEWPGS